MLRIVYLLVCLGYVLAQPPRPASAQTGSQCLFEPVPGQPTKFALRDYSRGALQFYCPENTKYSSVYCACDWVGNPVNKTPQELEAARREKERLAAGGGRFGGVNGGVGGSALGGTGAASGGMMGTGNPTTALLPPTTTTRPPCKLRAHQDRHKYQEFILGFDWMLRNCPLGTLYNAAACACHDVDPNQVYSCHPEMWINFNGESIEDSAGYSITIGNNGNVVIVSNAGRFDGTGTLTVWQYANQEFSDGITINLRFYEFPGGVSDEQVLVANCFGLQLGSIEIALDQITKEVIFRIEVAMNKVPEGVEIRIPYKEKAWKNVTMSYNGNFVRAQVDAEIKETPLKGQIRPRFNGLLVGSCNSRGYVGYIDDLRVFRCVMDQSMGTNPVPAANSIEMGPV